jgi:hypothetical protein
MVETTNKLVTGDFKYKLFLPQACDIQDEQFDKLSLINLKPVRMHPFAENCGPRFTYAPVDDDKVLLLSSSNQSTKTLQCDLIKTKGQRKLLKKQQINLGEYLNSNHKLGLVLKDGNVSYFAAFSELSIGQEVCTIKRVLLIQST